MNAQPIFTDHRNRPFKPLKSSASWTIRRALFAGMLIVAAPVLLMAAATQIDLTANVKGALPVANGGTGTGSTLTGLVRGNSSAMTAAELSGDVTTSGSNAATVVKINGTTIGTNAAADQVIDTTASGVAAWKTLGDTSAGGLAETYNASTHAFGTIAVISGTFSDAEVPSGTINGSTTAFTLAHTPSPAASLNCFLNGVSQRAGGADFTLATATITYGTAPVTGSTLVCYYRY